MDGHHLAGDLSVDASARLIRHYRYVEERMMRVMGGWIALTPELPAKLLIGRHVWDCAQHADLWGRRLPELRTATQQSEPANEAVVRFMDTLEAEEGYAETPGRDLPCAQTPPAVGVHQPPCPGQSRVRATHAANP